MPEEQQIVKVDVKKQSVFRLKDFYDFYYNLVSSMGYLVFEDLFSKEGDDTVWEWSCLKDVDDYFRYKLWTKARVLGAKSVKVKRDNVSESMIKATVRVSIKAKIITDWQGRWGTNPVTKFLKGLLDRFLTKPTIEGRKKELTKHAYLLENELKAFFELPRFM